MTSDEPDRPLVGVIGPGRVGTALASALAESGHAVIAVAGRPSERPVVGDRYVADDPSVADPPATVAVAEGTPVDHAASPDDASGAVARFVARHPHARPCPAAEVAAAAELVLLTVGDDRLADVIRRLATVDAVRPGTRWVHTSGRHGVRVLRPLALAGGRVAACHPAQTFPTPDVGRRELPGAAWAVTAAVDDRPWAHALVAALDGVAVDVREQDRIRYHAALSVGSNGTSAVVALARDLLLSAGIEDPQRFLAPLVTRSAANAASTGAAALTGPVRRGDGETVEAHLRDLRVVLPEAVPAYRALARLALSYAARAGLDDGRVRAMRAILEAGEDADH